MMFGDGGVGIGWDDAGGGLAMWIEAGDGWEGAGGQVDVLSLIHISEPTRPY